MKQTQDKRGLRYYTTGSQQQKAAVTGTDVQTPSYKLTGSSHWPPNNWIANAVKTWNEKHSPGRQQDRCNPGSSEGWEWCLQRGYLAAFCKVNAKSRRIPLHKYSQEERKGSLWCQGSVHVQNKWSKRDIGHFGLEIVTNHLTPWFWNSLPTAVMHAKH